MRPSTSPSEVAFVMNRGGAVRFTLGVLLAALACSEPGKQGPVDAHDLLGEFRVTVETRRVIPGMLSVPVRFTSCLDSVSGSGSVTRSVCVSATTATPHALALAARASARVLATGDVDALHVAGLFDLLWADSLGKSLHRSISYLAAASRLSDSGKAADALADLAAARIALAERQQIPEQLLAAVEDASHAIELAPMHVSAHFNVALGLDRLGLVDEAIRAWGDFERVGAKHEWVAEARARRAHLEQLTQAASNPVPTATSAQTDVDAFVAADPQRARLIVWDSLLVRWGMAVLADDSTLASQTLGLARHFGASLLRRGGDNGAARAVEAIHVAGQAPNVVKQLARAHIDYARGRALYFRGDFARAKHMLDTVITMSRASRSLGSWARFYRITCQVQSEPADAGIALFRNVLASTDSVAQPALFGHIQWGIASSLARDGRNEQALEPVASAARAFARLGEHEHFGAVRYVAAMATIPLHRPAIGFAALHNATSALRPYRSSRWLHVTLGALSEAAARAGYLRAAVSVQAEDLTVAQRATDPISPISARLAYANRRLAIGDTTDALAELVRAREALVRMPRSVATDRMWADAAVVEARGRLSREPERAKETLAGAIKHFAAIAEPRLLFPALTLRAEASLRLGDPQTAEMDLESALRSVEDENESTTSIARRATLLSGARPVFERLLALKVSDGAATEALRVVERSRTGSSVGSGLVLRPLRGRVVLAYAMIGDTLVIWTISSRSIELTRVTIDRAALKNALVRIRTLLELSVAASVLSPHLTALYDTFVRPVARRLGPSDELVIVPDAILAGAPLAAAYDSSRAQYLVEQHALRFAPTLETAMSSHGTDRKPQRAVLVSDPDFDRSLFPELKPLPYARAEVDSLARLYPGALVLSSAAARRHALVWALKGADILHFAGHAVYDDQEPEKSELIFAQDTESGVSGGLSASALREMRFAQLDLVVLAACESARSSEADASGFSSLVGAFLATGARAVVGSTWRVNDASSATLMTAFHSAYRLTWDAAAALRTAQRGMLGSANAAHRSPSAWAAFRVTGS